MASNKHLAAAYDFCLKLAQSHYENFPVASVLLPKRLRKPIAVIYAFARTADDYADEGQLTEAERIANLQAYRSSLTEISHGTYSGNDPIFIALDDVITQFRLPIHLFDDLLSAFMQDVVKNRYQTMEEVLDYCQRSANPVGRLLLHLNSQPTQQQLIQSDAICTSLQLINFYQDVLQDKQENDRIYIPQQMLAQAGLTEDDITSTNSRKLAPLLRQLFQQTMGIMNEGVELGNGIQGRLGWEIRAMTLGGIETLNKLMAQNDENILSRPRLTRRTHLRILLVSLSKTHLKRS
ncbi:squalene synthase HpnC [Methylophaga sulfidovorans]|uniref:Squalene synthase HpnC n=1 Tax=Methylophaga sulfidovorans TaxID=45496 RepID=A0A1I3YDS1_9GAMM|nr:squalene synthase HpnC [Methylophaga sulfidovorans]SFK29883.1 squalene synthase HpnC [Methylophaga sulfidovorans]